MKYRVLSSVNQTIRYIFPHVIRYIRTWHYFPSKIIKHTLKYDVIFFLINLRV